MPVVMAEINIAEIADTGRPRMKSANPTDRGVVTLEMNETVDVTPVSLFHLSNVFIFLRMNQTFRWCNFDHD